MVILVGYSFNFTSLEISSFSQCNTNYMKFFVDHEPIVILNDTAFTLYGFEGEGTSESPYIIENLHIESFGFLTSSIHVESTTAHFIIRNCYLEHEYTGITLNNVASFTLNLIVKLSVLIGFHISIQ